MNSLTKPTHGLAGILKQFDVLIRFRAIRFDSYQFGLRCCQTSRDLTARAESREGAILRACDAFPGTVVRGSAHGWIYINPTFSSPLSGLALLEQAGFIQVTSLRPFRATVLNPFNPLKNS